MRLRRLLCGKLTAFRQAADPKEFNLKPAVRKGRALPHSRRQSRDFFTPSKALGRPLTRERKYSDRCSFRPAHFSTRCPAEAGLYNSTLWLSLGTGVATQHPEEVGHFSQMRERVPAGPFLHAALEVHARGVTPSSSGRCRAGRKRLGTCKVLQEHCGWKRRWTLCWPAGQRLGLGKVAENV